MKMFINLLVFGIVYYYRDEFVGFYRIFLCLELVVVGWFFYFVRFIDGDSYFYR